MEFLDYQMNIVTWTGATSKENRIGLIKMLLGNLSLTGNRNVQNICARVINKKKFSTATTHEKTNNDEDCWFELPEIERLTNWAGYTREDVLVGYIKLLLTEFRRPEIQSIRSSYTYHAREALLYPERPVSRRKSVPGPAGWWSSFQEEDIVSLDCEMISKIVGTKSNGRPRCKQAAAKVSVVSFSGKVIFKRTIKYAPEEVYLTKKARKITGFTKYSFVRGTDLEVVKQELRSLLGNKLVIFINAGSDISALEMSKMDFKDTFDLHEYYEKDTGKIGLRSLVYYFYGIDRQLGIHDPDTDAQYTMKIFKEKYIPDKLSVPEQCMTRGLNDMLNEIPTIK